MNAKENARKKLLHRLYERNINYDLPISVIYAYASLT